MKFKKTKIKNCVEIFPSKLKDRRGFFQRIFCSKTFKEKKLNDIVVNINNSFSKFKGTTRGLHYQVGKFKETKIMRCIKGRCDLYVVDLNKKSKSFHKYQRFTLDSKKRNMVMVPVDCANGIQTLEDNTEIIYFVSNYYNPRYERGLSFFDPSLKIKLRLKPSVVSKKDLSWKFL